MKRIVKLGKRAFAALVLCAATAITLPAQTFTTLHRFDGPDGAVPQTSLIQATDGNLYGTTAGGGAYSAGTIFKITPTGTATTLYSFCSQVIGQFCADGGNPYGALVEATNGDFYGTTFTGGAANAGTVFTITPGGTLTTLYSFCTLWQNSCPDGGAAYAGLVQAPNGDFYGATTFGGANGSGTVFKITPSGTLTTLCSFDADGNWDGFAPRGALVQAADGDFYGTTPVGGANCPPYGCGTVFKVTPGGTLTTLYSFEGTDGAYPYAALFQITDGDLYGTTGAGGAGNLGTVFKITPSGTLTTLHSFDGTDGAEPQAALVQAAGGDFYGTTWVGGAANDGTVFTITPSGTLRTLHSFCFPSAECTSGAGNPIGGLVQATNGDFYGTAEYGGLIPCDEHGGALGCGTIFSLFAGLGPFVETQTTVGKVGAAVNILGTNLTGATSVSFNGTAAAFTVASPSLITTTVPAGATTGKVMVETPSGTISSKVSFRVLP